MFGASPSVSRNFSLLRISSNSYQYLASVSRRNAQSRRVFNAIFLQRFSQQSGVDIDSKGSWAICREEVLWGKEGARGSSDDFGDCAVQAHGPRTRVRVRLDPRASEIRERLFGELLRRLFSLHLLALRRSAELSRTAVREPRLPRIGKISVGEPNSIVGSRAVSTLF